MSKKQIEIPLYLKRNNYFPGRVLTAADFQAEQKYLMERMRLHNLNCHGIGVVSGLEVSNSMGPARSIIVSPGTALDPLGNEISLFSPVRCPVPTNCLMAFLVLYWAERETDPVPVPQSDAKQTMYSRLEEYAVLRYELEEDTAQRHAGVILARLMKIHRLWEVDPEYQVRRMKN